MRGIVEHARANYPSLAADALEVAGGVASFTGIDSPLTEAGGVGIFEPIADDTVPALTRFYSEYNAVPRVMVGPMSDPDLAFELARGGYVPIEHQSVLAVDLETASEALDPRIRETSDASAWAKTSMRGFVDEPASEVLRIVVEALATVPGVVALEAMDDNEVVATGGLALNSEIPALFGASTLPAFRGRGWQSALIRDRLTRAHRAGAPFARANARPLSQSEMNFVRMGFEVLYTRVLWEWRPTP
jgi:hypothetical protein